MGAINNKRLWSRNSVEEWSVVIASFWDVRCFSNTLFIVEMGVPMATLSDHFLTSNPWLSTFKFVLSSLLLPSLTVCSFSQSMATMKDLSLAKMVHSVCVWEYVYGIFNVGDTWCRWIYFIRFSQSRNPRTWWKLCWKCSSPCPGSTVDFTFRIFYYLLIVENYRNTECIFYSLDDF